MRKVLIALLILAAFFYVYRQCGACHFGFGGITGEGPVQSETRNASDFKKIDLDISGDVEFTQSANYSVEVVAQQNLLSHILTDVRGSKLHIHSEDNLRSHERILVRVSAPTLEGLSVGGSGNIRIMSPIQAEKMEMNISGSGGISATQSDFVHLEASISGSGGLELGGKADKVELSVSGSGEVNARQMSVRALHAGVSGSGNITADITETLDAEVSGSGSVLYSGSPTVNSSVSGSGSVKKMDAQ